MKPIMRFFPVFPCVVAMRFQYCRKHCVQLKALNLNIALKDRLGFTLMQTTRKIVLLHILKLFAEHLAGRLKILNCILANIPPVQSTINFLVNAVLDLLTSSSIIWNFSIF